MSVQGFFVEWQVGTETGELALQKVQAAFERADAEVSNVMQYVGPRLAPVFEAAEKRQFDGEGEGPVAGHWAALSSTYARWKAAHYPGKGLLERTGDLREALTSDTSPLASREWSGVQFAFGTFGVAYASFHQTGTRFMPARPPFDFDSQFEDDFQQAAQLGVVDAVRAARLDEVAEVTP